MRTINLEKEKLQLSQIFESARLEPVLLLAENGEEFILCQADEFESEVEALRNSHRFQEFLDERMKCKVRFPIEEIEKEIDDELKSQLK
jgi:PHD/YefM family antitoxin component YafN of YafNO toxin-antitoxin module